MIASSLSRVREALTGTYVVGGAYSEITESEVRRGLATRGLLEKNLGTSPDWTSSDVVFVWDFRWVSVLSMTSIASRRGSTDGCSVREAEVVQRACVYTRCEQHAL